MNRREPDLEGLLGKSSKMTRAKLPEETARLRRADMLRRASRARTMAVVALTTLHPEEFESLRVQARAKVDAELGPIVGDRDYTGGVAA